MDEETKETKSENSYDPEKREAKMERSVDNTFVGGGGNPYGGSMMYGGGAQTIVGVLFGFLLSRGFGQDQASAIAVQIANQTNDMNQAINALGNQIGVQLQFTNGKIEQAERTTAAGFANTNDRMAAGFATVNNGICDLRHEGAMNTCAIIKNNDENTAAIIANQNLIESNRKDEIIRDLDLTARGLGKISGPHAKLCGPGTQDIDIVTVINDSFNRNFTAFGNQIVTAIGSAVNANN